MRTLDGAAFAARWIRVWNEADLEGILAHYREDCVFSSPKAALVTGSTEVNGREALRAYWSEGLRRVRLSFRLRHVVTDDAERSVAILYDATIGDRASKACEVFRFDEDGMVTSSEAYYGSPVETG